MNTATSSPSPAPPQPAAVPPSLTEDGFLGGRLRILQPEKGFRAGIDSVFLAACVSCSPGETLMEAGMGTGVASLCVLTRVPNVHITGIEIAMRYALLAEQNAKRNNFGQNIRVIQGDVKDCLRRDLAQWPAHGSFNHVFANPPFHESDRVQQSPNQLRAQSHAHPPDSLALWVKVMHTMVTLRGTCTIVHRAESLGAVLAAMEERFGDIRVAPLYAREGMAASRVIVQGIKGSRAPLQLLPGLILHASGNNFTPAAEAILRDGMAWRLR
ncbi:MAG TPA: methyltransferase [Aestuariivirgaceae bacterium]|jgi:tRNA1(Val) A37 N6-methylase TrmN6